MLVEGNCSVSRNTPSLASQQDEIVAGRDAGLAVLLLGLPPPAAHVRHLEDLVLLEGDLVRVIRIRFVRVDRLGPVGVFGRLRHVRLGLGGRGLGGRSAAEAGLGR